jgi:CRISPR/Cas system-associated exonuclease Cas4 (RecB family)
VKVQLLDPSDDLIEAVAAGLTKEGVDYSGNLVVFPGKRPSHFLRRALARKEGRSFIPPTIFSMDEFIDWAYEEILGLRDKKVEIIEAVAVIYDIHKKAPMQIGDDHFLSLDTFFPLALKIYRDLEECWIEQVPQGLLGQVESGIEGGVPPKAATRLQSLSFFYDQFYRHAEGHGISTRALRYRRVAEGIEEENLCGFNAVLLCGFFAFTRSEKQLLTKMMTWKNTFVFFQQGRGMAERLAELGIEAPSPPHGPLPLVHFYSSPDGHGQVFALSTLLTRREEGPHSSDERRCILLPSADTLFPLLRQSLCGFEEEEYNVSLGYPLFRTPVFGFLNNLMELVQSMDGDRLYTPHYLSFVLHPYVKNLTLGNRTEVTRILFHAVEEVLRSQKTKAFMSLSEIEENEEPYVTVLTEMLDEEGLDKRALKDFLKTVHANTIGKFLDFQDIKDFAEKASQVLSYVSTHGTAWMHPLFHPFADSLLEHLNVLGRSRLGKMSFGHKASYFSFFRRYVATCHTPFHGTPLRGFQVLGLLEVRNLKFDTVFILDGNEDVIPGTAMDETLLPVKARRVLGLPTYKERDRLAAYYFDVLIGGAREAHLFFIETDSKEKSRFLERLIWHEQRREGTTHGVPVIKTVQYRVKLTNRMPDPVAKNPEIVNFLRSFRYNSGCLDTYLTCPLRFYYRYVLKLEKRASLADSPGRDEIGTFIHEVLNHYFRTRTGRVLTPGEIDTAEMKEVMEACFVKTYGSEPVGAAYLLKRQSLRRLGEFLLAYQLPVIRASKVTILHLEYPIEARAGGFLLYGRLDRIEERDGRTYLIDFKTGGRAEHLRMRFDKLDVDRRETWARAIGSLQLAFYLLLFLEASGEKLESVEPLFLLLGKSHLDKVELPLFDAKEDRETAYGKARTVILGLLREIVDGAVPFGPALDPVSSCPACDFQGLCGMQWIGRRP